MQAAGDTRRKSGCIAHQVEAIDEWANALHRRFGGLVAVAFELVKGPIVVALQKYDFFVLIPINPATLAKYRQAFQPSGAKDDPAERNSCSTCWCAIRSVSVLSGRRVSPCARS